MKIIRNNIIPFGSYKAINLFGVLFVKKNAVISDEFLNHESIHTEQMKEMLFLFFYLWYIIEWLIKLVYHLNFRKAYKSISFEREAYNNEDDLEYLGSRKKYAWVKDLKSTSDESNE